MTYATKLMCGILLLTIPTIQFGGYFLLTILTGRQEQPFSEFQKAMFRAGHAHAGVIVILAILCQVLVDHASLSETLGWSVRIGVPLAAILISGGFFGGAMGNQVTQPGKLISLIYLGIFVLAASLIILGIGLIRK